MTYFAHKMLSLPSPKHEAEGASGILRLGIRSVSHQQSCSGECPRESVCQGLCCLSHVNKITPLLLLFVSFPVSAPDPRLPSASTPQIHSWINFAISWKILILFWTDLFISLIKMFCSGSSKLSFFSPLFLFHYWKGILSLYPVYCVHQNLVGCLLREK